MWYTLKDFHQKQNCATIPFTSCACGKLNDYARIHQENQKGKDGRVKIF
jgi:hypothetical protein